MNTKIPTYEQAWLIRDEVKTVRKPFDLEDVRCATDFNKLDGAIQTLIKELPVVDGNKFKFTTGESGFFGLGVVDGKQQVYLMELDDRFFFIDTQGSNYARYVGELINFTR